MVTLPETGFLRLPQIIGDHKTNTPAIIPVCKTTWYNGIKEGRYPKSVKISKSSVAWRVDHIRQLVEEMAGAA